MFPEFGPVPISMALNFSSYEDDWKHVAAFRGQSGWLLMASATIQSAHDLLSAKLVVACDNQENAIPSWRAVHLTQCPWSDLDHCHQEPPQILDELLCEEEGAFYARWQREANTELAALHQRSQHIMEALDARAAIRARQIGQQINDLRRRRRMTDNDDARATLASVIADLERESDADVERLFQQRHSMRRRADAAEEALWQKTDVLIEVEALRLIHWRDGHPSAERALAPVWRAGRFYAPRVSAESAESDEAEIVLAKVSAALRANAQRQVQNAPAVVIKPHFGIEDLPKASPFLQKLTAVTVVPAPVPIVQELPPNPLPLTTKDSTRPINGKLGIERNLLTGMLRELEVNGQKFFAGSRKFEHNRLAREEVERKIAALDQCSGTTASDAEPLQATQSVENGTDSHWTPERVERLRELWMKGLTANQIAKDLGGTSRNAVIGKAKRLGIFFDGANESRQANNDPVTAKL